MAAKEASDYIPIIKARYDSAKKDPSKAKKKLLRDTVKRWAAKLDAEVLAANNEGQGYQRTPEEIGYPVRPMPRYDPKKWPYYQFGDYLACISGVGWYGVVIERKTLPDLYGTLIDDEHRENLYEEIGRFKSDQRFKIYGIFRTDFECTEEEFFDYFPPCPKTCKFCIHERVQTENGDMYCPSSMTLLDKDDKDFKCHNGFLERQRTEDQIRAINKKKETVLRTLRGMGVQLCWRGCRESANEAYKPELQAWCVANYERLLKLEGPEDLELKKARLEAELSYVNDLLEVR